MVPWFYAGCSFTVFACCIQELCCLDFLILVLFTPFGIPHFGIMLPRFHVPCFIYGIWILELCCLDFMILVLFTTFAFCILELCCLDSTFLVSFTVDSMIIDYLRTVFGIQGIYYTLIMLPRFHRVRTRWPGNNLWQEREKLAPISRIICKKSPSK